MLRICIVSDGLPFDHGGAQLRAYRHTQRLQAMEEKSAVMVVWDRSSRCTAGDALPPYVYPVRLCFQDVGGTQTPVRLVKLLLHLGELSVRLGRKLFALRHKFDVLHVINAASWFSLVTIPIAKTLKKPVVVEMVLRGADDPLKLDRRAGRSRHKRFLRRPLKYTLFLKADAYVTKSHALSAAYRQAGLPEEKLFQIPSGVDVRRFKPPTAAEKRAFRRKLALDEEQTVILFVGGINERKGAHRLLAAFREVAQRHSQAFLLVVGPCDSSDEAYLRAIRDDVVVWDLSTRVALIVERVDNADEYMKAADIFALPTSREGLSVAVLEAMSSGLAIVASDIPEIALSQIQDGVEGLLVPLGDTAKLAGALSELIGDAAMRARLGRAARQRVLQEFTLAAVNDQYLRLYERLVKGYPDAS